MCGEGQRPDARPCEECRPVLDAEIERLSREPLRVEQVVTVQDARIVSREDHA